MSKSQWCGAVTCAAAVFLFIALGINGEWRRILDMLAGMGVAAGLNMPKEREVKP